MLIQGYQNPKSRTGKKIETEIVQDYITSKDNLFIHIKTKRIQTKRSYYSSRKAGPQSWFNTSLLFFFISTSSLLNFKNSCLQPAFNWRRVFSASSLSNDRVQAWTIDSWCSKSSKDNLMFLFILKHHWIWSVNTMLVKNSNSLRWSPRELAPLLAIERVSRNFERKWRFRK